MDNNPQNIPNTTTPVNPVPQAPQVSQVPPTQTPPPPPQTPIQNTVPAPQPSHPGGRKLWIFLIIVLIVLIPALFLGYMYLNSQKSFNAGVYKEPTTQQITLTPTPTPPEIDSTDTSDAGLEKDSQKLDQNLSSVDADLNNVDQSLNDQQTNLQ